MSKRVDDLIAHLQSLSNDELREQSTTPEFAYFMHRVYELRPEEQLTVERIAQDSWVRRQYPCSTEYYEAQMELNRQRFEYAKQGEI